MMGTTPMDLETRLESTKFLSSGPVTKSHYFERCTEILPEWQMVIAYWSHRRYTETHLESKKKKKKF